MRYSETKDVERHTLTHRERHREADRHGERRDWSPQRSCHIDSNNGTSVVVLLAGISVVEVGSGFTILFLTSLEVEGD